MPNEGGPNELGNASFGLNADISGLQKDLKQAEQTVAQSVGKMSDQAQKVTFTPGLYGVKDPSLAGSSPTRGPSSFFSTMTQSAAAANVGVTGLNDTLNVLKGRAREVLSGFLGWTRILGVIGLITTAITGAASALYYFVTTLDRAKKAAHDFEAAVQNAFALPQQTSDLQKQLDGVDEKLKEIEKSARATFNPSSARFRSEMDAAIASANRLKQTLQDNYYLDQKVKEANAASQRQKEQQAADDDRRHEVALENIEDENASRERARQQITDAPETTALIDSARELKRSQDEARGGLGAHLLRQFEDAEKVADELRRYASGNQMAQKLADQIVAGAKAGLEHAVKEFGTQLQITIRESFTTNVSQQTSQFGIINIVGTLENIERKLDALPMFIPR